MSGYLTSWFFQQYRLANGLPNSGGSLTTYANQTSIPKSLYYDVDLQNPCPNPLPLDSAGFAPEYYLGLGLYTFVVKDSLGNIIATRDNVAGILSTQDLNSISATSAAYRVKIDDNDTNPGYLWNKLSATDTIDFTNTGDKIAINVKNAYKIKGTSSDSTPGYLVDKIGNTSTIQLSVSAEKLYAEYVGIQPVFEDSPTISWITSGNSVSASVIDSGKVKISSGDTLEYLEDKIQAGSGIVFTQTEDINGKQIHISTTNSTTNAGKVKVTSADSLEYLSDKFIAGPGISISASDNNIIISQISATSALYFSEVLPFTSAVTITATAAFDLISIDLPAGTWDLAGNVNAYITPNSGANVAGLNTNISTSSTIFANDGYDATAHMWDVTNAGTVSTCHNPRRITLETFGTVYLVAQVRFGLFTSALVWGTFSAKQVI